MRRPRSARACFFTVIAVTGCALTALSFAAMAGPATAQAQEPDLIASIWQAEADRPTWSDHPVRRDATAPALNFNLTWQARDRAGSPWATLDQALDPPMRFVSCYEASQFWRSDDVFGGTFGRVEGARGLGSMIDSYYARHRWWAQFDACARAGR